MGTIRHSARCYYSGIQTRRGIRCFSSQSSTTIAASKDAQMAFIFGANTDVGKTVISAGLVQASIRACGDEEGKVNYVKPLQCGGSDQAFVDKHVDQSARLSTLTLFRWNTPTSPHVASRIEQKPVSDDEVHRALQQYLRSKASDVPSVTWIETAGGVLSPSSSSPENCADFHAKGKHNKEQSWGWLTQADLYKAYREAIPVVLVGDGRLGGISATLTALESMLARGYLVDGVILLESEFDNQTALREYANRTMISSANQHHGLFSDPGSLVISLPQLPPEPEPLFEWYHSVDVTQKLDNFYDRLTAVWQSRHA